MLESDIFTKYNEVTLALNEVFQHHAAFSSSALEKLKFLSRVHPQMEQEIRDLLTANQALAEEIETQWGSYLLESYGNLHRAGADDKFLIRFARKKGLDDSEIVHILCHIFNITQEKAISMLQENAKTPE